MRMLLILLMFVLVSTMPQDKSDNISDEEFAAFFGTPTSEISTPASVLPKNDCQCVYFYQCVNGTYNVGGIGILDERLDNKGCKIPEFVCCKAKDVHEGGPIGILPPSTRKGCGYSNVDGVGFRFMDDFDDKTLFGEFPWTGIVFLKESIRNKIEHKYHSGCSLIHPRVALTAAHRVAGRKKTPEILKVRFGEWNSEATDEVLPHQDRSVVEVVVHDRFSSGSGANDIALLILDKAIELADNIGFICLPPPGSVFDGEQCISSGWNKNAFNTGKQNIMKKVELEAVSHSKCQSALRSIRGSSFRLHESFVCAGGQEGKDTCSGDGGSPLMCPITGQINRYYQVGIVSWGVQCGMKGIPGVYTNVPFFTMWIEKALKDRGIEIFFHKP